VGSTWWHLELNKGSEQIDSKALVAGYELYLGSFFEQFVPRSLNRLSIHHKDPIAGNIVWKELIEIMLSTGMGTYLSDDKVRLEFS
jgi:hypothetical protein